MNFDDLKETKAERRNKFNCELDLTANKSAYMLLNKALASDSEYAWSWHCNMAVNIEWEGIDPIKANKIAARIMQYFFEIDTTKHRAYPKIEEAKKQEGNPFKVGGRINFYYEEGQRRTGKVISEPDKNGLMLVRAVVDYKNIKDFVVHYKQCELVNDNSKS